MKKRPGASAVASANVNDYRRSFLAHVHELLKLGYERMRPTMFANREEEEITEELVIAIEQVLDEPTAADWVDDFAVHEEKRVNALGRHGKKRLRIDIRIDSARVRPRSRFLFEAKRLGKGHPTRAYLGAEGLGAYLSGEYASDHSDAGMIGYVQQHDAAHWSSEIGNELTSNLSSYACRRGETWNHETLVAGLQFVFSSIHDRDSPLTAIRVFHTFLLFH